jgi:hypothetical protein
LVPPGSEMVVSLLSLSGKYGVEPIPVSSRRGLRVQISANPGKLSRLVSPWGDLSIPLSQGPSRSPGRCHSGASMEHRCATPTSRVSDR